MTEDYALVGEAAEFIRQETFAYDNETEHEWHEWAQGKPGRLGDRLADFEYSSGCYPFAQQGRLVYADVNQKDPAHKKKVYGILAKEPPLEVNKNKGAAIKEVPVEFLMTRLRHKRDGDDDEDKDDSHAAAEACLTRAIHSSMLNTPLVDFFIQLKDKEGMRVLLETLSKQSMRKSPRPVMVLIGMIDKAKTDKRGLTEGWAIGYDFLKGDLIIKPFVSKKDCHPLGDKWHDEAVNDGINFKGTPADFADRFVALGNQVGGKTEIDGLKLLVHTSVAGWILQHRKGFSLADPGKWTDAKKKSIGEAMKKITSVLNEREAVIPEKAGERKRPMEAFEDFANKLAGGDQWFRCSALEARESGNGKAAQNAAEFYDRLAKDLKSFNENPDNQF